MKTAVRFLEKRLNEEASRYIEENYEKIAEDIRRNGWVVKGREYDLLNDVYESILRAERNGEGYDPNMGKHGYITVSEFVHARLKGYAKNGKYRSYDESFVSEVPASYSEGEEVEDLDSFQKAYAMASEVDDLESIDEEVSLRENIEYCLEFNDHVGFDMMNLFKNIDLFKTNFNSSIFNRLKLVVKHHDEFGEALRQVLSFASKNRERFEKILAEF
jgi:hypothetical protein